MLIAQLSDPHMRPEGSLYEDVFYFDAKVVAHFVPIGRFAGRYPFA